MIIVGSVIKANTKPPANGDDLGSPKKFKNIAKPNNPKTMEGTAAKLLILTSIIFVILLYVLYRYKCNQIIVDTQKGYMKGPHVIFITAVHGNEKGPHYAVKRYMTEHSIKKGKFSSLSLIFETFKGQLMLIILSFHLIPVS